MAFSLDFGFWKKFIFMRGTDCDGSFAADALCVCIWHKYGLKRIKVRRNLDDFRILC